MLDLMDIEVAYGGIRALHGVSLRVEEGEIVALAGANGAGKTTVLRTISGLVRPSRGEVRLEGARIDRLSPERIVARGISHVPEGRGIFPSLTVGENLRMGFFLHRRDREAWRRGFDRAVGMFPRLGERWDQQAGTLSGGEQQMLAIARGLLTGPRLLMVDELSLGLAPMLVRELFDAIVEISRQGTTILLVEQHVHLSFGIADRAYVLAKGAVASEGKAADLLESGDVARSYLGGEMEEVSS